MGFSFDLDGFMDDLRVIRGVDLPPELSQKLARRFLDRHGSCSGCKGADCTVGVEERAFVEGFEKAFWYVLSEVERKTTTEEILSWFAGEESFCPFALRSFEVPDYDREIEDSLRKRLEAMRKLDAGQKKAAKKS